MATPKKPSGWNSLTPAQQAAWKKKNFNMKVKVTETQLDKLRAKKTPEKAIAAYKGDPKMREALYRFYGKDRVNKAIGKVYADPSRPKPKGPNPNVPTGKNNPGKNYIGAGNVANYKTKTRPVDGRGGANVGGKYGTKGTGTYKVSKDKIYREQQKANSDTLTVVSMLPGVGLAGKAGSAASAAYKARLAAKAIAKGGKRVKGGAETVAKMAPKSAPKRALPKGAPKPKVTAPRITRKAPRKTGRGD
jgi:hypothetical protein